jgi:Na+/phosphate symporter
MIKELLSLFKENTLMDRAFQRSYEMLDLTQEMFLKSKDVLRNRDHAQVDFDINDEDSAVNKYQREVRKDVFNHLALTGVDQLASGLVLVSIVIDIERIGDFTKNIVEIAVNHPARLLAGQFEEDLNKIENAVEENFKRTIDCFKRADEEAGRELVKDYKWVSKVSDKDLMLLINEADKSLQCGSAVALALYLRALKRVNSHLRNVSSSVVNPFHRIGYKLKKKNSKE